jgi:hypothetical protein
MRRAVVVLGIVLACGVAHAEKKRQTGTLLSGVGAGVSSALVVGGFVFARPGNEFNQPLLFTGLGTSIVTPSLGEWYAGEWVTIGMAVRAAGAGLAIYAVRHEQELVTCDTATSAMSPKCTSLTATGIGLLGVAAIAYVGGVAYDVKDAGDAVDRYNSRHHVFVSPTAILGSHDTAPGLALVGTW